MSGSVNGRSIFAAQNPESIERPTPSAVVAPFVNNRSSPPQPASSTSLSLITNHRTSDPTSGPVSDTLSPPATIIAASVVRFLNSCCCKQLHLTRTTRIVALNQLDI